MDEHPTKIYKLEKFGQGYDKQIILNYNKKTADKMGLTPELGWINLFPDYFETQDLWQCDIFAAEDLEYVCAKSYASNASIAFLESFHKLKNTERAEEYCEILKKYNDLRSEKSPGEATKEYLLQPENSATLIDGELIKTKYPNGNVDFVDFAQILCDDKKCYEGINNKPLYQDLNHLNQDGSNLVAPKLIQKIDKMLAD